MPALSVRVTAPDTAPAAVGINCTRRVQLAPGASVVLQPPPNAKGPLMVMLLKFSAELPEFVTLKGWNSLMVPTVLAGNFSDAGDRLTPEGDEGDAGDTLTPDGEESAIPEPLKANV